MQKPDYSLAEFMFLKNCPQSHEWFLYLSGLLKIIWLVGLMKKMLECLACLVFLLDTWQAWKIYIHETKLVRLVSVHMRVYSKK